jgi:hypothetical protein
MNNIRLGAEMDREKSINPVVLSSLSKLVPIVLCLLALCACSSIPNTHLHNAVPLPHMTVISNSGLSSSSFIYRNQDYSPACADSFVKDQNRKILWAQTPVSYTIGLGKDYAIGAQLAFFIGPGYTTNIGYSYMSDLPYPVSDLRGSFYARFHLQKSFSLGDDCYLAAFPAYGVGAGVESIADNSKLRYGYQGVELPVTISKQISLPDEKQIVISGTARIAYDTVISDLSLIERGFMNYTFHYFPDQARLNVNRNALMGHLDYYYRKSNYFGIQLGMEQVRVNGHQSWEPIVFFGWGTRTEFRIP